MKLLDRYIATTILSAIFLVTLMLAGLQIFILFVNELDELGQADYGIFQALQFVILQMPYQVYLFFPIACLLGSLTGLGILANYRELIIMRAAGMSIGQITLAVLKAACVLILLVTFMGEWLVPKWSHIANDKKMQALSHGQVARTASGIWLRYQDDFIGIGSVLPDNTLSDVYQFSFDKNHQMRFARQIGRIVFFKGAWHAYDVAETVITETNTRAHIIKEMPWEVTIKPSLISSMAAEPDEMRLGALGQYIKLLHKNRQSAQSYELVYWQRIVQPLSSAVMMLLAIPFIFGSLRSSTMGSKILVGATVGFGFHIINRFFGPVSQVLQWPPSIAALGPTLVFAVFGMYLMRRLK